MTTLETLTAELKDVHRKYAEAWENDLPEFHALYKKQNELLEAIRSLDEQAYVRLRTTMKDEEDGDEEDGECEACGMECDLVVHRGVRRPVRRVLCGGREASLPQHRPVSRCGDVRVVRRILEGDGGRQVSVCVRVIYEESRAVIIPPLFQLYKTDCYRSGKTISIPPTSTLTLNSVSVCVFNQPTQPFARPVLACRSLTTDSVHNKVTMDFTWACCSVCRNWTVCRGPNLPERVLCAPCDPNYTPLPHRELTENERTEVEQQIAQFLREKEEEKEEEEEDDVPTFDVVIPEPVADGTQAVDVDGDEWIFKAEEDAWVRVPVCSICYDPAVGTYGPSNEPLCQDCRDEEGFCSCGDVLKDCDACNESEDEDE